MARVQRGVGAGRRVPDVRVTPARLARLYDRCMTVDVDTVRQEAMALSERERADIAADLLFSLGDDDEFDQAQIDQEWAIEARRRADELRSGDVKGVAWSDVFERVRQRPLGE